MSQVLQRLIDAGLEGEAAMLQAALTRLARGEDIVLSPRLELLAVQAQRRCGPFAPPPRDFQSSRLGLRRPAIG